MNFELIPLAKAPWGFAAVVSGTLGFMALVALVAWRRGWF
jgi:Mg2+ and Co2+ transporter CorA